MTTTRFITAFFLSACLVFSACTPAVEESLIHEFTLKNGVHVILQPMHTTPVAAIQVWVHVGSKDEKDKTRGLAHIYEHMLFQGTETYPPGSIFSSLEAVGGDVNAYTSIDRTVYHVTMPAENYRTGIDIFSSMMHEALIPEKELAKEVEVVMEEFRRAEDNPNRALYEALMKTIFTEHPYKHPIIGYRDTIETTTRQEILDFYEKWYVPENMTVVLVGDLDVTRTRAVLEETFGIISPRESQKRSIPPEPEQHEARARIVRAPFQNARLGIGFPITPFDHPDTPAIDTLFVILGMGESSRLTQRIREELQIVTDISAFSATPEDKGFGMIEAQLEAEKIAKALPAILQELYVLHDELVTDEELQKAKLQIESDFIFEQEDYRGIAETLGFFHLIGGGVEKIDAYLERLQSLTAEDLQAVAQKYLQPQRLSVVALYPEEEKDVLSEERLLALAEQGWEITQEKQDIDNLIASRTNDEEANVTKIVFKNGLTLLLREDHNVPTFAYHIIALGGLLAETPETNGISRFASILLMRGTETKDQKQIAVELEGLAATLSGFSGKSTIGLAGSGLSRFREEVLVNVMDILQSFTFPEDQVEHVRDLMVDAIRRQQDQPAIVASQQFQQALFGQYPWAMSALGTENSIQSLMRDDLFAFAHRTLTPDNLIFSIVGDFTTDDVIGQIGEKLGRWEVKTPYALPEHPPPIFPKKVITRYSAAKKQQSNIILGFPSISLDHPDFHAFQVLDKILSGASGRLFSVLRNERSLAYSVSGQSVEGFRNRGWYAVRIGTEPRKTQEAIDGITEQLQLLIDEEVTAKELKRAQDYLVGSFAIDLQTFSAQSANIGFNERYALGYRNFLQYVDRVRSVTAADIQRLAKEYFTLDRYVLSVVGPEKIR